ncbi:MAG: hypothetical protein CMJ48_04700 [Planctomycetaceae bacterium]|nr:hypothetical protein [Planctomycetaceae bacterium]
MLLSFRAVESTTGTCPIHTSAKLDCLHDGSEMAWHDRMLGFLAFVIHDDKQPESSIGSSVMFCRKDRRLPGVL